MTTRNANNERIKRRYFSYLEETKRQSELTVNMMARRFAVSRFIANTVTLKRFMRWGTRGRAGELLRP